MRADKQASGILPWLLQDALPILLILLCNALIVTVCSEALWRASLSEAVFWLFSRVLFSRLNLWIFFAVSLLLTVLTRRLCLSVTLCNLVYGAAALIHYFKLQLRNEPLFLTDISQAKEAMHVAGSYSYPLTATKWIFLFILLVLPFLLTAGIRLRRIPLPARLLETAAAFAFVCLALHSSAVLYNSRLVKVAYKRYYFNAGILNGLVATRPRVMQRPEGYSEEAVYAAMSSGLPVFSTQPEIQPDIFFIMCETLYDPSKIPELHISGDVFPRLHALQQEAYGGELIVSQFGGGTAQTEYEVLTGYRSADTFGNAYLTGALRSGMDSFVTLLRAHGYYTQAMHPSDGATYHRQGAYKALGFDRSLFIGDMSKVTERIGSIPADSWLFPEILSHYDECPKDQPRFTFVVTYQNHGGYLEKKTPWQLQVSGPEGDALTQASNYVNGLYLTDEAIERFIEKLRGSDRPALVVLFGDHAPSVGLFDSRMQQDTYAAHTTPLLVWANYPLDLGSLPQAVSSYRLSALIAQLLGYRDDPYLNSLRQAPDLFFLDDCLAEDRSLVRDAALYEEEAGRLRLLHYDRVHGKRWASPAKP